MTIRNYFL